MANYIKSIVPMKDYRLFMEMEGGSSVIVDLSVKLHTNKYKPLENAFFFSDVKTDGNYVTWGDIPKGRVQVTVKELMEIVLYGGDFKFEE